MSVATCGGTDSQIPLRAGRIDATEAGPSGVPTPEMVSTYSILGTLQV